MNEQKFVLQIIEGPDTGLCFGIAGESVLIGRAAECDIRLENARGVSRNHCRVFVMDDGLRIQDLDSQNGTIIQGKRVADAIIKPGISFKVGDVVFLAQTADGLGEQYALANAIDGTMQPLASAEVALAPGEDNTLGFPSAGGMERSQELLQSAGENSRKVLLQLAILIAFIVAGLYLVQLVSLGNRTSQVFALVRAYEPKCVNFGISFSSYTIENNKSQGRPIISLRDYNGLLQPSLERLKSNRNAPRRRMMVVEGGTQGDVFVILRDSSQKQIGRFRIVCRGVDPYYSPEELPQDKARLLAGQAQAQADFFLKDSRLYDAWAQYKRAAELYNGPGNSPARGSEIFVEVERLRTRLSDQLCRLFDDALAAAFPAQLNIRKPDYTQALLLLEEAKNVIPDEASVDRQLIENWMMVISSYKTKQKSKNK